MQNAIPQFPKNKKKERPVEISEQALDELSALVGIGNKDELKQIAQALVREIENAPRTGRTLENSFKRDFTVALESAEQKERLVGALEQMGIFPWEEDGLLVIDHRRDLRKIELLGLRKPPVFASKPADEALATPAPLPPHKSTDRRSLSDRVKGMIERRREERNVEEKQESRQDDEEYGMDEEVHNIISRFDQGLIDEDDTEFVKTIGTFPSLRLFPRQYLWAGRKIIEARTGREITDEEREHLYESARAGDADAMNKVARIHTGLVLSVVVRLKEKFRGDPDDFFQEGMLGLMGAISTYERGKGRFTSHAVPRIENAMRRYAFRFGEQITRPEHMQTKRSALTKAREASRRFDDSTDPRDILNRFAKEKGSFTEHGGAMHLDRLERRYLLHATFNPLEDEANDDTLVPEQLRDDDNSETKVKERSLREKITQKLSTLRPREERVLRMRFGISVPSDVDMNDPNRHGPDPEVMTLEEIGERMGISKDRVRQIEASALRHLKHPSRSRALRSLLDFNEE